MEGRPATLPRPGPGRGRGCRLCKAPGAGVHVTVRQVPAPSAIGGLTRMSRYARLREIERLDPERDCQRIMHRSFGDEIGALGPPRLVEAEKRKLEGRPHP